MRFYYKDLNVRFIDKQDTARKGLLLALENALANDLLIHTNNSRESRIFFVRDQEKFVFNFWAKSTMSGILTSTGIRRNRNYEKQYTRLRKKYFLP